MGQLKEKKSKRLRVPRFVSLREALCPANVLSFYLAGLGAYA